jgi:hypothetical protein
MKRQPHQVATSLVALLLLSGCAGPRAAAPKVEAAEVVPGAGDLGSAQVSSEAAQRNKPAQTGQSRAPTLREERVIGELMDAAERVRELHFKQRVPVQVQDQERIAAYVETQIKDDELKRAAVVYTALGLLAPDLDVRALLVRVMREQIVGYYDDDEKRLCVRDDIMHAFADPDREETGDLTEARMVLVHELVHALQDQNLGLSQHIHDERDTDADNAFHALVEGDATLAMIGYALEREQVPLHKLTGNPTQVRSFSDVVRRSPLAGTELEKAPAIIRVPLLSAYVDGLAFCASLHGAGGWAMVNQTHATPPTSTEQVLHPERFAHGETATRVHLPVLPALAAARYRELREDTLGELELSVYLSQGSTEAEGRKLAAGWGGDRLRVYEAKGAGAAVVWLTLWDSDRYAEQAAGAAERVRNACAPALRARSEVLHAGRAVLILRDLPDAVRAQLKASFSAAGLADPAPAPPATH